MESTNIADDLIKEEKPRGNMYIIIAVVVIFIILLIYFMKSPKKKEKFGKKDDIEKEIDDIISQIEDQ